MFKIYDIYIYIPFNLFYAFQIENASQNKTKGKMLKLRTERLRNQERQRKLQKELGARSPIDVHTPDTMAAADKI